MELGQRRRLSSPLSQRAARFDRRPSLCSLLLAASVLWLGGCGKALSEDDCRKIADNLREAWQAESQKTAAAEGVKGDKVAAAIKAEGDKLVSDWSFDCKKELEGRRVDPKELECLRQARTIEQINRCGEP
jgi:hypothetical protein